MDEQDKQPRPVRSLDYQTPPPQARMTRYIPLSLYVLGVLLILLAAAIVYAWQKNPSAGKVAAMMYCIGVAHIFLPRWMQMIWAPTTYFPEGDDSEERMRLFRWIGYGLVTFAGVLAIIASA